MPASIPNWSRFSAPASPPRRPPGASPPLLVHVVIGSWDAAGVDPTAAAGGPTLRTLRLHMKGSDPAGRLRGLISADCDHPAAGFRLLVPRAGAPGGGLDLTPPPKGMVHGPSKGRSNHKDPTTQNPTAHIVQRAGEWGVDDPGCPSP